MNQLKKYLSYRALLSVEGIGPGKFLALIKQFDEASEIFNATPSQLIRIDSINKILAQRITDFFLNRKDFENNINGEFDYCIKNSVQIIYHDDENFPKLLKSIYNHPIMLYVLGDPIYLSSPCVAVVGTRTPSQYGKIQTEKISAELARNNYTVVSGLARGIDSLAHTNCLKNGGKTIAVTGSGIDVIYPSENKELYQKIIENGCVVTEFPPKTKPDAQNFPKRNRIISGLSLGSLIIETRLKGGAMQTALFALEQNREVFAIPGNLGSSQSEGTNLLIQRGEAKLIRNVDDIIQEFAPLEKNQNKKFAKKEYPELSLFEQKLVDCLNSESLHIDDLSLKSEMSTSECLVYLLTLEFKGIVKQLPGKNFILN